MSDPNDYWKLLSAEDSYGSHTFENNGKKIEVSALTAPLLLKPYDYQLFYSGDSKEFISGITGKAFFSGHHTFEVLGLEADDAYTINFYINRYNESRITRLEKDRKNRLETYAGLKIDHLAEELDIPNTEVVYYKNLPDNDELSSKTENTLEFRIYLNSELLNSIIESLKTKINFELNLHVRSNFILYKDKHITFRHSSDVIMIENYVTGSTTVELISEKFKSADQKEDQSFLKKLAKDEKKQQISSLIFFGFVFVFIIIYFLSTD